MVLGMYVLAGYFFGPQLLLEDIMQKYRALAEIVTVSATVLPPPSEPAVSGDAACPGDVLTISLDWTDDDGATSFDVYRDSLLLVSGLTDSEYDDTSLSLGTTYSYEVVAYGPMGSGSATSDVVSISTPIDCLALTAPTIAITSIDSVALASLGSESVSDDQPLISGTSNMPSASVVIALSGPTSFSATVSTNINGYWEWTPSTALSDGEYTLTVSVANPFDSLQSASSSASFSVDTSDSSSGGSKKKKKKKHVSTITSSASPTSVPEATIPEIVPPSEFTPAVKDEQTLPVISLEITNPNNEVFQQGDLAVRLHAISVLPVYEGKMYEVRYTSIDASGEESLLFTSTEAIWRDGLIEKIISVPRGSLAGMYTLRADIMISDHEISSAETAFRIVPIPLLDFGGSIRITRDEVIVFIGRVLFGLLFLLLFLFLLFIREYAMYSQTAVSVAEESIGRKGYVRKEVKR